jgi:hypothetical protein
MRNEDYGRILAVRTSETSANFNKTARHDFPENSLHALRRQNLKFHIKKERLLFHFKVAHGAGTSALHCPENQSVSHAAIQLASAG